MTAQDSTGDNRRLGRFAWWRHLSRVLLVVACLAGGHLGGVAATKLVPVQLSAAGVSADLELTLTDTDRVIVDTTLGDVIVTFDSGLRASGIRITPRVESGLLTGSEALPPMSLDAVRPLAREAATALALRYAAGAAVGVLGFGLVLLTLGPIRRHRLIMVVAVVTVLTVQAAGMARTFRAENFLSYRADGLLGEALAEGQLAGARLDQRTVGLAKYLNRWQSLQRELARPQDAEQEPPVLDGPSFLLVSDIHGIDSAPVISQLVQNNEVSAVIDSGDLLNAGYVQEAELTGIFDGIENLGVPYIFVLGNHDRRSAGDRALIERMSRIPNVVLLMPEPDTFNLVEVGGVRIAGVNDELRWFGDDDTDNAAKQVRYTDAFNEVFADVGVDLAVTHEPSGARRMNAPIRLAGHVHTPSIVRSGDGATITNGTLTGGGIFGQNDEVKKPGEVTPQTVMVLTYGGDCRAAVLRTIEFSGQLDGRFAVNRTSLDYLNGLDEPDRTCLADGPLTVTPAGDRSAAPTALP